MKYLVVVLALLLSSIALGQSAKVVILDPDDAQEAKQLWDRLQRSQKAWSEFQDRVHQKYLIKQDGWNYGFEFSTDFRAIVPKDYTPTSTWFNPTFVMPPQQTNQCLGLDGKIATCGVTTLIN